MPKEVTRGKEEAAVIADTMLSRLFAIIVLAGLGTSAFCQAQAPSSYSDGLLAYRSLFFQVVWLEDQANKLASQGKNDSFMRSLVRRQANLSVQEEAALKMIAADWRAKDLAINAAAKALMAEGARGATSLPLQSLVSQRKQNIADHITQLKATFAPVRFPAFNFYVYSRSFRGRINTSSSQ